MRAPLVTSFSLITSLEILSPNAVPFWDMKLGLQHMNVGRHSSAHNHTLKIQHLINYITCQGTSWEVRNRSRILCDSGKQICSKPVWYLSRSLLQDCWNCALPLILCPFHFDRVALTPMFSRAWFPEPIRIWLCLSVRSLHVSQLGSTCNDGPLLQTGLRVEVCGYFHSFLVSLQLGGVPALALGCGLSVEMMWTPSVPILHLHGRLLRCFLFPCSRDR